MQPTSVKVKQVREPLKLAGVLARVFHDLLDRLPWSYRIHTGFPKLMLEGIRTSSEEQ